MRLAFLEVSQEKNKNIFNFILDCSLLVLNFFAFLYGNWINPDKIV